MSSSNNPIDRAFHDYLNQNPSDPFYNPGELLSKHGGSIMDGVWQPPASVMFGQGGRLINGIYEPPINLFPPPTNLFPPPKKW